MERRAYLLAVILVSGAALCASCKREHRTFRVLPAEATATDAVPNTPFHPAGASTNPTTSAFPLPPRDGFNEDANAIAEGQVLYRAMNCAGCHSSRGGGAIGPALSDEKWIYGWQPQIIYDSIVHGRPNGMLSFGGKIPDDEVWKIVAYVRSLSGLISPQSAPGRSDDLAGGVPPNSLPKPQPGSDNAQLRQLHEIEREDLARRGWIDPHSTGMAMPQSAAEELARQLRGPASRAAATKSAQDSSTPAQP